MEKVLIITHNAPNPLSAEVLYKIYDNFEAILPPNVTALLQTMDQGAIVKLKKNIQGASSSEDTKEIVVCNNKCKNEQTINKIIILCKSIPNLENCKKMTQGMNKI